ncbi:hypothetical protein JB92DRAFT_2738252 [Gautieria morchelliformis]|nr:hypothetical protein JB92DRAFT_2738252 [Gautieria morchelliformis]
MENLQNGEDKQQEPIISALFCAPEADLLLCSSDRVELRVFSRILIEASPIFRDMTSLPKPTAGLSPTGVVNRVDLDEDRETLELLLQFLYPMRDPQVSKLDVLKRLMKAADKYILDGVTHSLKRILVSPAFVDEEPLRVYALACMYGHEAEAKIASRHCLKIDILVQAELYEELSMISGRDLLRLIKLHQTRAAAILEILNGYGPSFCTGHGSSSGGPLWWTEFKTRAKDELRVRPMTDTILQPALMASCVNYAFNGGCQQCPMNYLSNATQARLEHIKTLIDALPDTV